MHGPSTDVRIGMALGSRAAGADWRAGSHEEMLGRLCGESVSRTSLVDRNVLPCGQWRARRDGIAGIYGNRGIVESVTYRI